MTEFSRRKDVIRPSVGMPIPFYTEHGTGTRDRPRLDALIDKCETPWIVPADGHH